MFPIWSGPEAAPKSAVQWQLSGLSALLSPAPKSYFSQVAADDSHVLTGYAIQDKTPAGGRVGARTRHAAERQRDTNVK